MGDFLDKIKLFMEQQKSKRKLRVGLRRIEKQEQQELKQSALEREVSRQVKKEETLTRLRQAQAKRIGFEQKILKAKASRRQQTKRVIKGGLRRPVTFRKIPVSQAPIIRKQVVSRPIGGVLLDRPKKKGKGTPGLGTSFRVL